MQQEQKQLLTNNPLVSIVIVTYNSSKYVLETLESASAQSYKNIELIVSDDGSSDNTVDVCSTWLKAHQSRFTNTRLLTVSANTGISANCNRGFGAATGSYIKGIAGDDILMDNCIADNVLFIAGTPQAEVVFSRPKRFGGDPATMKQSENSYLENEWIFSQPSSIQLTKELAQTPFWYSATMFIKKEAWQRFKFDESYPMIEDTPFMLKYLRSGGQLFYFPMETVKYRFGHSDSVQHMSANKTTHFKLYKKEFFKYDIKHKGMWHAWHNFVSLYVKTHKSKWFKLLLLSSPQYLADKSRHILATKKVFNAG